jgi:hypothetical protein
LPDRARLRGVVPAQGATEVTLIFLLGYILNTLILGSVISIEGVFGVTQVALEIFFVCLHLHVIEPFADLEPAEIVNVNPHHH